MNWISSLFLLTAAVAPSSSMGSTLSESEFLALPVVEIKLQDPVVLGKPSSILPEQKDLVPIAYPDSQKLLDQGWVLLGERVVPTATGSRPLPSLGLVDKQGHWKARTVPFEVKIQGGVQEALQPEPKGTGQQEEGPHFLPAIHFSIPLWILSSSILVTLAVVIYWAVLLYRSFSRKTPKAVNEETTALPILPADQEALQSLQALEAEGLYLRGRFKEHFFAVSEIMKRYAGRHYGFDARESTSSELLGQLREKLEQQGQDVRLLESYRNLFDELDRVKFTDHVPDNGQSAHVAAEARRVVGLSQGRGHEV